MGLQIILIVLIFIFALSLWIDISYRISCLLNFRAMCEVMPVKIEKRSVWLKLFFNIEYLRTLHYFLMLVWIAGGEPDITIRDIYDIRVRLNENADFISTVNEAFMVINPQFGKAHLQFEGGGDGTIGEI